MKKILLTAIALAVVLSLTSGPPASSQSSYRVIVHSGNPVDEISRSELSGYLLKKKSRWDHGAPVEPVDLIDRSPVRAALSEDVHGRSVASIKNYWQRQIFSGRNVPPPEVAGDSDMVAYVAGRPGAVGYVSSNASISGVKTLRVVD
ncbi:MAG: hypothetical protein AAGN46_09570 [Acidobacteriota bacterium]